MTIDWEGTQETKVLRWWIQTRDISQQWLTIRQQIPASSTCPCSFFHWLRTMIGSIQASSPPSILSTSPILTVLIIAIADTRLLLSKESLVIFCIKIKPKSNHSAAIRWWTRKKTGVQSHTHQKSSQAQIQRKARTNTTTCWNRDPLLKLVDM